MRDLLSCAHVATVTPPLSDSLLLTCSLNTGCGGGAFSGGKREIRRVVGVVGVMWVLHAVVVGVAGYQQEKNHVTHSM